MRYRHAWPHLRYPYRRQPTGAEVSLTLATVEEVYPISFILLTSIRGTSMDLGDAYRLSRRNALRDLAYDKLRFAGGAAREKRLGLYRQNQPHLAAGVPRPCDAHSPLYVGSPGRHPKTGGACTNLKNDLDHLALPFSRLPRTMSVFAKNLSIFVVRHNRTFVLVRLGVCPGLRKD